MGNSWVEVDVAIPITNDPNVVENLCSSQWLLTGGVITAV
jgi:hypothetical protein